MDAVSVSPSGLERSAATAARSSPWIARIAWVVVAVFGGAAVDAAVDGRSGAVAWTAAIGGWAIWGAVALALAIPSVRSLTVVRLLVPISIGVAGATAVAGADALDVALLALPSLIAALAAGSAEFGRQMVQASAYGDEERFPLRAPAAAGVAAVVSWVVWSPALIAGPLLLAARQWVAGGVLTAVAVAGLVVLAPRWHRMSKRWFVLVPAGIVVHDPVVLADTFPLRTAQLATIRLAPADTEAADLTGPASGYAVEVSTTESVTALFAFTPQEPNGRALHLRSFLIAPSRPGQALGAARRRGLPVT